MAIESHIDSLKVRHQQLETKLDEMLSVTSIDEQELNEVKRKKLAIKDKINTLQAQKPN